MLKAQSSGVVLYFGRKIMYLGILIEERLGESWCMVKRGQQPRFLYISASIPSHEAS